MLTDSQKQTPPPQTQQEEMKCKGKNELKQEK